MTKSEVIIGFEKAWRHEGNNEEGKKTFLSMSLVLESRHENRMSADATLGERNLSLLF